MKKKEEIELIGVKEIARRAKVSIGTVDRVLHNRKGVSEETKEKINQIIRELNYQPNLLAKRLASRKTFRLATLIPQGSDETSFWDAPLQGIEQAAAEISQLGIIVDKYFYDQNSIDSFVAQTEVILASKPDGILLAPSFMEESVRFTSTCKKLKIPYVLIDSDLPNQDSLSYIGPNLYHSGYLSAHLISYLTRPEEKVLIVNISKEIDDHHHLLKKEEGFRAYFKDRRAADTILKVDITQTDPLSVEKYLAAQFEKHDDIRVVFVTNSRVSIVAQFLAKANRKALLIGYDFLQENLDYLDKGQIDFLICQKPMEQAYKGVMALYQHLAFSAPVEKICFMPIDIITKENYSFYKN
ncbi:LacI family DNA-binding transcriptional regulator [Rhabdobacter roseus]|uniref:LacI family transcriptional regulator n=1 Tax=Rhabdobacter roseus TaxID=1655419 RepID=A0A840TWD3_9BACT|nr:substrate-binding domain-containing protein [Rhabdobacter roseus]MBB5284260.1 LacI family transcriptional regulator [Rhabdobacter roseus]